MFPQHRGSGNFLLKSNLRKTKGFHNRLNHPLLPAPPSTLVQMNHREGRLVHLDVLYCLGKKKKKNGGNNFFFLPKGCSALLKIGRIQRGQPTKHTNCCFDWLLWILFVPITNSSCRSVLVGAVLALTGKKRAGRECIFQINSMLTHYKIPARDEMAQHLPSRLPLFLCFLE